MKYVEKKDLAKKLGVDNILINHFEDLQYKNSFTIILNEDLALNYVGKTYSFIPLTANGLGKEWASRSVSELLNNIKEELTKELESEKDIELDITD